MSAIVYTQDAGDRQDYDFTILSADNDTVSVIAAATISPSGSLVDDGHAMSGATAKVWLRSGQSGVTYDVSVAITTTNGRIKVAHIQIAVK